MYRPEGWENPFNETVESVNKKYPNGIAEGCHILLEAGRNEGFEAGADAMLEGLLKSNEPGCEALRTTVTGITGDVPVTAYGKAYKGKWVFIPEEA